MGKACALGGRLSGTARGLALAQAGRAADSPEWGEYVRACDAWRTHRAACDICRARYGDGGRDTAKTVRDRATGFLGAMAAAAGLFVLGPGAVPQAPAPNYADRVGLVLLGNETAVGREKAAHAGTWIVRIICTSPAKCGVQAAHYAAEADRYGVRLVLRVWGWREGVPHISPGGDCTDVDVGTWAAMVGSAAEKLAATGATIQAENEPNQCSSPREYAERTAAALRAAEPYGVPVWLAGMADADADYLLESLAWLRLAGASRMVDAVAIHEYDATVAQSVRLTRDKLDGSGYVALPLYVTETGAAGDGLVQAEHMAKRLRSCLASVAVACFVYRAQDEAGQPDGFGLLRHDGSAKPAWGSFAWFASSGDAP